MTDDATRLNLSGIAEGTDKTYLGNDYLQHYARIFAAYKDLPINVLEIGVSNGGSLRTWQQYFSQATIIGIDIQPKCAQYAGDRMIVEIGSQTDEPFLQEIARRYQPQIIIDDGSHLSSHQIISLECLFSLLPAGGIYVIEDMFFQANPATPAFGDSSPLALDYLTAIARDRTGWIVEEPSAERRRTLVGRHVERVEFFRGCAALFKYGPQPNRKPLIEMALQAATDATNPEVWWHLFNFAIRNPIDTNAAELAATKAFEITGDRTLYNARMERVRAAR
jgi:hypothetical protein